MSKMRKMWNNETVWDRLLVSKLNKDPEFIEIGRKLAELDKEDKDESKAGE